VFQYSVDWSSAAEISDVAQVVDGRWNIVNDQLTNAQLRYDRAVVMGDIAWTDYEVTAPVTVNGFSTVGFQSPNFKPAVGVMLRWPGHSDWTGVQPTYGWYPGGGGGWIEFETDGSSSLELTDFTPGGVRDMDPIGRSFSIGTTYIWKLRVESEPDGAATYRLKVWEQGAPEPANWELSGTELDDVQGGSLLLLAHFTEVSFGNIQIEPL
jgi:hypothetical protein